MTVWFDVDDLFEYARTAARPSGVQRLSFELYVALRGLTGGEVAFVRHDRRAGTVHVVEWSVVEALYSGIARGAPQPLGPPEPLDGASAARGLSGSSSPARGVVRSLTRRLPDDLRRPLGAAARSQAVALRELARAAKALPRALAAGRSEGERTPDTAPAADCEAGQDLRLHARAGDVFAVIGAPWSHPRYAEVVGRLAEQAGLRVAMLVYDFIPVLRPEFCHPGLDASFSHFMRTCLPIADVVLAISRSTASDAAAWVAREGIALRGAPRVVPIGTGFAIPPAAAPLPAGLSAGGYALFVSTLEARKNHALAFRAWRRLLDELPAGEVPTLVFAGRRGWLVNDLMQQIENSRHLDGKLVVVEAPGDATLAALYRGARFTLFPSLYEGWGLPVSESLAFGKVCLAAAGTSIPEAGGVHCLYHDPDSVTEAAALYRRAITEPGLIAALGARIAAEYRPTPWSDSARAVLAALRG